MVEVRGNAIRMRDTDLTPPDVKDLVKRTLHRMRMDEYRVVTQGGIITIRERTIRRLHSREKRSVPSVKRTLPYFFPG